MFPGAPPMESAVPLCIAFCIDHAAASGASLLWQASVTGLHPGRRAGCRRSSCPHAGSWVPTAPVPACAAGPGSIGTEKNNLRFGFRRHYRVAPWTDFMELHWGRNCQIYVTPVGGEEVCVALISSSPQLRLDDALAEFPELRRPPQECRTRVHRTRRDHRQPKLRHVYRGNTVLVGDASGGVDAITGEGLCLAFRQSALLADCLADGDLARYQVRTSPSDSPSRPHGSPDVADGQTRASPPTYHAGFRVEPTRVCRNARHARRRRLNPRLHR